MNPLDSNTVNIIDVIYFENLIIMYNEPIYCRWFYWELFDKLSVIYGNKCILGGNTFYIIDDKKDNINSTHYNGYTFSTKNGKVLTLNEIGTPIQLYEDKEHTQLSLYFLHRITISYDDLQLPEYYYASAKTNRVVFEDEQKLLKFVPGEEKWVFDQNVCVHNDTFSYKSFIMDYIDNNDYRFTTDNVIHKMLFFSDIRDS